MTDNAFRAALHFSALANAGSTTYYGAPPPGREPTGDAVIAGVSAFLHGYAAPGRERATREQRLAPNEESP